MTTKSLLREGPSQPATILNRAAGLFGAAMLVSYLYAYGLPHAIYVQATQPNPISWLNPFRWRDLIIEAGLPRLLAQGDKLSAPLKKEALYNYAKGKVLELGAGTGLTLQYYNRSEIDKIYLVEPFEKLHDELRKNIKEKGSEFEKKAVIIPFGVEESEKLKSVGGIDPGTFDTIVLVQVLCSIPNRKEHLPYLQSLLKPGGQLLLFEHVASEDPVTNKLQNLYNPVWTVLSKGCNVNRHSAQMVKNQGGWKEVQVQVPDGQNTGTLYPHAVARYVRE